MRRIVRPTIVFFGFWVVVCCFQPVSAAVKLGTGNASLIGGDLTDPEDDVVDRGSYDADKSEADLVTRVEYDNAGHVRRSIDERGFVTASRVDTNAAGERVVITSGPDGDLDGVGLVSLLDLGIVLLNFGQTGDP